VVIGTLTLPPFARSRGSQQVALHVIIVLLACYFSMNFCDYPGTKRTSFVEIGGLEPAIDACGADKAITRRHRQPITGGGSSMRQNRRIVVGS